MPGIADDYAILLEFSNDTLDCATVQLSRDYGRNSRTIVLLQPGEVVALVLEAGSTYKYVLRTPSKVASVTARGWRDLNCTVSQLFASANPQQQSGPVNGLVVDRIWREYRMTIWNDP
ncbi:hypothetical protein DENSPDRAFT_857137 [Dentipellis sp. KUC8613]|nr:hypothetical protein DENSPDRAFT_857137 [Dentipellis sp. KUC8613]